MKFIFSLLLTLSVSGSIIYVNMSATKARIALNINGLPSSVVKGIGSLVAIIAKTGPITNPNPNVAPIIL